MFIRLLLPWIWVSLNDFLAVFSPSVTVVKNVDITCCLYYDSRLSHGLASVTIPTVCFIFSFPENTQKQNIQNVKNFLNQDCSKTRRI